MGRSTPTFTVTVHGQRIHGPRRAAATIIRVDAGHGCIRNESRVQDGDRGVFGVPDATAGGRSDIVDL